MASLGWIVAAVAALLALISQVFGKGKVSPKIVDMAVKAAEKQAEVTLEAVADTEHAKLMAAQEAADKKVQNAPGDNPNAALADFLNSVRK